MRWTPGGTSRDIEDRRSAGGGRRLGGRSGLGLGGILLLFVLSIIFKTDFFALVGEGGMGSPASSSSGVPDPARDAADEPMVKFVSFVLDDAQQTWTNIFQAEGREYPRAKLVLFRDSVDSACGFAQAAMGPFYCPGDSKVYIDLGFYRELDTRFGAPGDFAQAYVLAHEIGHHVQNVLGIERQVRGLQGRNPGAKNELSVRMELQADCFAGVWGHSTSRRDILDKGDIEEGLGAAAAVGDDRIQQASRGRVVPESFTHGSSQQRMEWFQRGFTTGKISACNTFGTK
jgi:predicted metalloprotease